MSIPSMRTESMVLSVTLFEPQSNTGRGTHLLGTPCFSSQDTLLSCLWAFACAIPPSHFSSSGELLRIL